MERERQPARRSRTARILIVDDRDLDRAGLRSLLTGEPGLEVVAEASSGGQALALCHRLRPDLVLMDVRMPDMDGLAAAQAIKQEFPRTCIIVFTMHDNVDYLAGALEAGASGYLLKDATRDEVISAVRRVLEGEAVLDPSLTGQLLGRLKRQLGEPASSGPERLTARELTVLQLIARGLTNREIADNLKVSLGTAKIHVERIIAKLGVSDRTQAAVRAVHLGLVTPEPD